jgi:ParB-like chromosome segregation protein Spo0J
MSTAKNTTMKIDEITVGERHRRDMGDLDALAAEIELDGLLQPPGVRQDGTLVFGARRLAACKRLGWTEVPVRIVPLDDIVRGEFAENAFRKNFTPSELVSIRRALKPAEKEAARERQALAGKGVEIPQSEKGRVDDKIAKFAGVDRRTVDKAEAVVLAAEKNPKKFGALVTQMDERGMVEGAYRRLKEMRGETPKANGYLASAPWTDQKRLIDDFSDFEWGVLAAINPAVRDYVGFGNLDDLDDDSWEALQMSLIEARQKISAFIERF